jgi:hypothetical protein
MSLLIQLYQNIKASPKKPQNILDVTEINDKDLYKIEKNTYFLIIITIIYFLFTFYLIINDIIYY